MCINIEYSGTQRHGKSARWHLNTVIESPLRKITVSTIGQIPKRNGTEFSFELLENDNIFQSKVFEKGKGEIVRNIPMSYKTSIEAQRGHDLLIETILEEVENDLIEESRGI